jgi:phage terminase small subunit
MTPKQERFIEEYLIDLNATQAAIRAGYSEKTAAVIGVENLKKPNIQQAIQNAIDKRSKRTKITQDMVLEEIAKLSFSNMLDYMTVASDGLAYVDLSKLTREQAAAIQEITIDEYTEGKGEDARDVKKVKVKLADKKGSLELLGRHLKMFTDKIAHEGTLNVSFAGEDKLQDED